MNLLFRMILTFAKCLFCKRIDALETSTLNFRVLPFDLDINFHLTNSRYFSFMDLGRLYYTGQTGLMPTMLKKIWQPVVASCEVSFLRQVRLFSRVTLTTQLLSWDDKYQYFYQRFNVNGHIVATAIVKTALYSKGRAVPSMDIVHAVDPSKQAPALPDSVTLLKQLDQTKKHLHG